MRRVAATLMALAWLGPAAAAAPADLYLYVRELQALQDGMVRGDAGAQKLRMKLLSDIGRRSARAAPAAETGMRDTRAAIVYILSGGMPEVGEACLASASVDPVLKPLLEGAMAYARGDKEEAARLLASASLEALPPALAGQIFLIRSSLRKAGEHDLMRQDLRMARLLMPGTLVEESALRRSAAIEAEARDLDAFEQVSSLYFRRFAKSVYAGQFASAFVQFASALDYETQPQRFAALAGLIGKLPRDKAVFVFLGLAQKAVLSGQRALGVFTAREALDLAEQGGPDEARAQLYSGAALVTGKPEDHDAGARLLGAVDRQYLIPADAALLRSALALAAGIRRAVPRMQGPPPPASSAEAPAVAAAALKSLADTEAAMEEGR